MLRRTVALLLALALLGSVACAEIADPATIVGRYNARCALEPSGEDMMVYLYDPEYGDYLSKDMNVGLMVADWGIRIYALPALDLGARPIELLCEVLEDLRPNELRGLTEWGLDLRGGNRFDCALFEAEFSLGTTEMTDHIPELRIEYK